MPPTNASPTGSPDQLQRSARAGLSLENKRYLLYLYTRLRRISEAEVLAAEILKENPRDKETLALLLSIYLENKNAVKSLATAKKLAEFYPRDPEIKASLAQAYSLAGDPATAERILAEIQRQGPSQHAYPNSTALAAAALQAGDWHRALVTYRELLEDAHLTDPVRAEIRKVIEQLYRDHLPQLELRGSAVLLQPGTLARSAVEYRQQVTDANILFAGISREDVHLDADGGIRERSVAFHQGRLGIETSFSPNWQTALWAGGSDSGPIGGASLIRKFGPKGNVQLRFDGRERAPEGLLFESLDGRQNRLGISGVFSAFVPWTAFFELYGRELSLADQHLGYSHGGSINIERAIFLEKPELRAGYHARWMFFSRDQNEVSVLDPAVVPDASPADRQGLLRDLVLSDFHRQGVYLSYADHLSGAFYYHASSGVDYAFERRNVEYNASVGFSFFPRKSIELRADSGYSSSSTTSDRNSDEWQVGLAVRCWF